MSLGPQSRSPFPPPSPSGPCPYWSCPHPCTPGVILSVSGPQSSQRNNERQVASTVRHVCLSGVGERVTREQDGSSPSLSLTVQLYLIQSSQNREAENFFRITTVMPWSRHCPIPTMFPEGRVGLEVRRRETLPFRASSCPAQRPCPLILSCLLPPTLTIPSLPSLDTFHGLQCLWDRGHTP